MQEPRQLVSEGLHQVRSLDVLRNVLEVESVGVGVESEERGGVDVEVSHSLLTYQLVVVEVLVLSKIDLSERVFEQH